MATNFAILCSSFSFGVTKFLCLSGIRFQYLWIVAFPKTTDTYFAFTYFCGISVFVWIGRQSRATKIGLCLKFLFHHRCWINENITTLQCSCYKPSRLSAVPACSNFSYYAIIGIVSTTQLNKKLGQSKGSQETGGQDQTSNSNALWHQTLASHEFCTFRSCLIGSKAVNKMLS